jgi:hypothetical protein
MPGCRPLTKGRLGIGLLTTNLLLPLLTLASLVVLCLLCRLATVTLIFVLSLIFAPFWATNSVGIESLLLQRWPGIKAGRDAPGPIPDHAV